MLSRGLAGALLLAQAEATKIRASSFLRSHVKQAQQSCDFALERADADEGNFEAGRMSDSFPADSSSLYWPGQNVGGNQLSGDYVQDMIEKVDHWARPEEIIGSAPSLWGLKGVQPHGIQQGQLGDCWFLAGAAAVAEWPNRVKALFTNDDYPENGLFELQFYYMGEKHDVMVDDQLPVDANNALLNARQSPNNAWWFVIMEKAYAKFNLNYAQLNGGWGVEALRALTGMPVEGYNPKAQSLDEIFRIVQQADWNQYAMTAGCSTEIFGLVSGHLYTLLGAVELSNGVRLLKLRNPWGSEMYNGPYSDCDDSWTPELKAEAGVQEGNDGIFFLEPSSFQYAFDGYQIAMIDDYKITTYKQSGQTGKQFAYSLTNDQWQDVVVGIDYGAPRVRPDGCGFPDVWYNFYIYDAFGNEIEGAIAAAPHTGYGQAVLKDLAPGEYRLEVTNWGDATAEAVFNLQAYGKWAEVGIGEAGKALAGRVEGAVAGAAASTGQGASAWAAYSDGKAWVKVEKDWANTDARVEVVFKSAEIPWYTLQTNVPDWYYDVYAYVNWEDYWILQIQCPGTLDICYFEIPDITDWAGASMQLQY